MRTVAALVAALVCSAACDGREKRFHTSFGSVFRSWNPLGVQRVGEVPVATLKAELAKQLDVKPARALAGQWEHTKQIYKDYHNSPLWLDEDGLMKHRVDDLIDALVNATDDGIDIDRYSLPELATALQAIRGATAATPEQLARADILLTSAYVGLAEDYLKGQVDPAAVNSGMHTRPAKEEVDSAVARSIRDKDVTDAIARMRPQDPEYESLRLKLDEYRKIVTSGGWQPVPDGDALKRGERADPARLQALRARLQAEGYQVAAPDSATAGVFDASLAAAIAQFQERHAIVVDSQLGKETLDALNVPATFRLTQITANLERYRWLPRTLGSKYIKVNVPAFRLEGFEDGRKTIEMKVIVGADYEDRATPVFSDRMEYIVFRPYWDVPPSIAAKEYTNGVPADFDVSTRNGELHLRQRPGPKNALGLVKFIFPNDYNVYLHDTPNDNLFKKDVRAFSHGCIRLEKPGELAEWVLGWDAARVREAMENGPNDRTVRLPNKIPVYIAYFTAYMRDGQLWFGNDLYRRDAQLSQVVAGGALPSGDAVRAVEALRKLTD